MTANAFRTLHLWPPRPYGSRSIAHKTQGAWQKHQLLLLSVLMGARRRRWFNIGYISWCSFLCSLSGFVGAHISVDILLVWIHGILLILISTWWICTNSIGPLVPLIGMRVYRSIWFSFSRSVILSIVIQKECVWWKSAAKLSKQIGFPIVSGICHASVF